jgi:hypothetical protein
MVAVFSLWHSFTLVEVATASFSAQVPLTLKELFPSALLVKLLSTYRT